MVTFHNGNILDSGADIICHQVNCRGVMGSGVAKQIKELLDKDISNKDIANVIKYL